MSIWKEISKELFRRYEDSEAHSVLAVNIEEEDLGIDVRLEPDEHPTHEVPKGQELSAKEIRRYLWDIRNREDLRGPKAFYVFHDEDDDVIHVGTADLVAVGEETE
jgi:hypothetical protein